MAFTWLAERRRRRRILAEPFPAEWRQHLAENMVHFRYLSPAEAEQLSELAKVFVVKTHWEGCGGLELTDEMRVTIAGQACLLLLGLKHLRYRNVETILVYPSTMLPKRVGPPLFALPSIVKGAEPLIGEAHHHGPVILAWDAVRRGGAHPESRHNVVYHEFAHKLDMLDGYADGVPPLRNRAQYRHWNEIMNREYDLLRTQFADGQETFLDPYGAINASEFFAVATEYFFDQGHSMSLVHPELYEILREFYRHDTAAWQLRREVELGIDGSRWSAPPNPLG